MRDPWKDKTGALYDKFGKVETLSFSLDEFREWLDESDAHTGRHVYRCEYCRALLPLAKISIDHEIPVKMGGPHALSNFAVCCEACNGAKGGMSNWTFIKILAVLDHCSAQERADVLGRLRAGQWRTARARNYKRRRAA